MALQILFFYCFSAVAKLQVYIIIALDFLCNNFKLLLDNLSAILSSLEDYFITALNDG